MKIRHLVALVALSVMCIACGEKHPYRTVENDPLKTRIYTLDNGLKIFINVNKETPRIQTYIAVKVGSKNDPAETTGLAHYFEHLMFKGTDNFGTMNYEAEKPLLDKIEQLFEQYRQTTDEAERKALYHVIDSVSYEASKYAIPNEYDKLMSAIGSDGSNAYTWYDMTVYVEDIPSNQVDNWAKIEGDRFANAVIRGFHTELEAVYEEKNMSLTDDNEKVFTSMLAGLFPHHPYGTQTTLGTQENLKNPSITNIKNYYNQWYVPNNIAICMSGDIDPDKAVESIERYFGGLVPNDSLPELQFEVEPEITAPVVKDVYGLEAESVSMAWRTGGAKTDDACIMPLISAILYNGQAGLIDLDLNQQQKALYAYGTDLALADYGMLAVAGAPKQGQTLDNVKELLLAEVDKLRRGDFPEELLSATIANFKANKQRELDTNAGRANLYVEAFVDGVSLEERLAELDRMSRITKQDVVDFVTRNLRDDNYVIVYKHQGVDNTIQRMPKPEITPIATNRDTASTFLREIQNTQVTPIEPVFVDYKKDMQIGKTANGVELLYKKNTTTDLFSLNYRYDFGAEDDPELSMAADYLGYLGTSDMTADSIARAFYDIACSFSIRVSGDRTTVSINGLSENMDKAVQLTESLLADASADEQILAQLKNDLFKARDDAKHDQKACFAALRRYGTYGGDYVRATTLSDSRLASITSQELLSKIKSLPATEHRILYYGPDTQSDLTTSIDKLHKCADQRTVFERETEFVPLATESDRVVLAQYDSPQIYYAQVANTGKKYDASQDALITLYNGYFGGGMNTVVFQEMREARGLAYSAWTNYSTPSKLSQPYTYTAFIATQNDKLKSAAEAFAEIINNMPVSEPAFNLAKESLLANLRSQRTIKIDVLNSYLAAQRLGLDYDRDQKIYNDLQSLTLDDVVAFQRGNIKGLHYTYMILGDEPSLDSDYLSTIGGIEKASTQEIFGY